jgi:hypothetical protein
MDEGKGKTMSISKKAAKIMRANEGPHGNTISARQRKMFSAQQQQSLIQQVEIRDIDGTIPTFRIKVHMWLTIRVSIFYIRVNISLNIPCVCVFNPINYRN